jgi:aspartyl-tRNA(Asn)/glutamyl-tRNA(Gln) amidotransferase subunit C
LKLTREEVAQIAFLARLELSDQEVESLGGHINRLLENFESLRELDTDNVEPTSHTIPVANVFRPDVSRPSLTQEEVLANAPERVDGTFEVPRIVET